MPVERIVVIPNGVRVPPEAGPGTDAVAGRQLAGADRYLLAVGTVEPRKDLPLLVDAFDLLESGSSGEPGLRLVIAGPDGWGADALTSAIARSPVRDRIVRLGWVSDDQRVALLRGAAAMVFPSVYEGFGLPPLDAMATGTPVVATAAGAVPEVVGDAAVLVPPGDADALAEAIQRRPRRRRPGRPPEAAGARAGGPIRLGRHRRSAGGALPTRVGPDPLRASDYDHAHAGLDRARVAGCR